MNDSGNRSRIDRFDSLVDPGDLEPMLELFAGVSICERPGTEPLHRKEQLEGFYGDQRVIESDVRSLNRVNAEVDNVVVKGTFDGLPRDRRDVSGRFAEVFELRDGFVTERCSDLVAPAI